MGSGLLRDPNSPAKARQNWPMSVKRKRFVKRECPVCGGSRSKVLFQQRFEQLYVASTLDGYDVVICEDCGTGFADDIPPQSVFDDYYRDMSKYDDGKQDDEGLPEVEQRLRDLAALIVKFIPTA